MTVQAITGFPLLHQMDGMMSVSLSLAQIMIGSDTDVDIHTRNSSRTTTPEAVLIAINKPWRTPSGNCRYSIEEIDEIRNDILNGTSVIAEINKKEM